MIVKYCTFHERLLFWFPSFFVKVTPCGRESNSQMSESAKVTSWIHVLMTSSQAPWVSCLRTPEHTEESFIIFTHSRIIYTVNTVSHTQGWQEMYGELRCVWALLHCQWVWNEITFIYMGNKHISKHTNKHFYFYWSTLLEQLCITH